MKWITNVVRMPKKFAALDDLTKGKLGEIAKIHETMPHAPLDPQTQNAYSSFKDNVLKQYHGLKNQGVKFEFSPNNPYTSSKEMRQDFQTNNRLKVYNAADFPEAHPMAEMAPGTKQTYNSLFRAVHDAYGHAYTGHEFGPQGELNAYKAHAQMFPKEAYPALAAETLAQNAWINYGPHNPQALRPQDRPYPPQKAYAFPQHIAEEMAQ